MIHQFVLYSKNDNPVLVPLNKWLQFSHPSGSTANHFCFTGELESASSYPYTPIQLNTVTYTGQEVEIEVGFKGQDLVRIYNPSEASVGIQHPAFKDSITLDPHGGIVVPSEKMSIYWNYQNLTLRRQMYVSIDIIPKSQDKTILAYCTSDVLGF